jgi:hypothetical protein
LHILDHHPSLSKIHPSFGAIHQGIEQYKSMNMAMDFGN